jgi:site-specific DNA recombinase
MREAYGYTRVSSPGQATDDRDGIPRQKEAIEKCAASRGISIVHWFEDAISGTKDGQHRKRFQEMLNALVANGVKIVIFEKLERLAGALIVQEQILVDFEDMGVEPISAVGEDLSNKNPNHKLQRQLLGAFNEYRRAMIFAQTQAAKARKRATDPDYREGRKPYGHKTDEQETVKRVLELHAAGKTLAAICAALTEEGRKTRTGGKWFPTHIARILKQRPKTP